MSLIIESYNHDRLKELKLFLEQNLNKFHKVFNIRNENREINQILDNYKEEVPISSIIFHISVKQINKDNSLIERYQTFINELRQKRKITSTFIIILFDYEKEKDDRQYSILSSLFFQCKVNMVTLSQECVNESLKTVIMSMGKTGDLSCPICSTQGIACTLSKDDLRSHIYMFHSAMSLDEIADQIPGCPICKKPMTGGSKIGTHIHENHGPEGEPTEKDLALSTIYPFVLVVVHRKRDNTFLLVNEAAGRGWWLPGGRVNVNESLQTTGKRETKEESGIDIELKGVLRMEYSPHNNYSRLRIIFYANPVDEDQLPKSIPDYESVGASYVTIDELKKLNLRGKEPILWFNYVNNKKPIHPLSLISLENALIPN